MKRCTKCVLPETMPNIHFDENGVCNYCHSYKKFRYKGENELLRLLNVQKEKNNKYDCIVNISGGRDSSFTLLKLVKDYDMNVLAVNYQNSFTDPQADVNIRNAVEILGVDLVRFKRKENVDEGTFRHNLNAWLKKPSPAMIPMMCVACKNLWWDVLKIAKKNGVKSIVSGGNPLEESSFKLELLNVVGHNNNPDSHFTSTFRGVVSGIVNNYDYINFKQLPLMIKGFLFGNPYAIGPKVFGYKIDKIDLFHYIPWKEDELLFRIKSELNWDYPHSLESTWRFDCLIGHLKDLLYMGTIGMTEKDEFYSKMIREGLITREKAIERLDKENNLHMDQIEILLQRAGITEESLINNIKNF